MEEKPKEECGERNDPPKKKKSCEGRGKGEHAEKEEKIKTGKRYVDKKNGNGKKHKRKPKRSCPRGPN